MNRFLLSALLIIACCVLQAQPKLPPVANKFVVIAHRGDHTVHPENTLASIKAAIEAGADYVEIDLRTTADKKLVLMHDATIDRMTNGKGKVNDHTLAQLQQLQVKEKHSSPQHERIPSFQEALEACRNKINIYLDFKDADVNDTWQQICTHHMQNSVVVYINASEQYEAWRKVAPQVPLMVSLPDSVTTPASMKVFLEKTDAEILDGDFSQYTCDMVVMANAMGRVVWTDGQREEEDAVWWQQALPLGIQGLQTDHPGGLIEYLKSKKIR